MSVAQSVSLSIARDEQNFEGVTAQRDSGETPSEDGSETGRRLRLGLTTAEERETASSVCGAHTYRIGNPAQRFLECSGCASQTGEAERT